MATGLYLAFSHDTSVPRTAWELLVRCCIGDLSHCEIVIECEGEVFRCTVFRQSATHPDDRVFRTPASFDSAAWTFLQVPCSKEQLILINKAIKDLVDAEVRFSWWRMALSATPFAREAGEGIYCTEFCVLALQAAGMLVDYPAYMASTIDLFWLAKEHLCAYPHENPTLLKGRIDTMGLLLSRRVAYNQLFHPYQIESCTSTVLPVTSRCIFIEGPLANDPPCLFMAQRLRITLPT